MHIHNPPILLEQLRQPSLRAVRRHLAHKQLGSRIRHPIERVAPLAPACPAPVLREGCPPLLGVQPARAPAAVPCARPLALLAAGDVVRVGAVVTVVAVVGTAAAATTTATATAATVTAVMTVVTTIVIGVGVSVSVGVG